MKTLSRLLIFVVLLIAVGALLTGCGSLRETRKTYNLDGTPREEVRLKAKTFMSQDGLRGLRYTITGGSNDISRELVIESLDRDVSTNAAPLVTATGNAASNTVEAVGGAVGNAVGKAVNTAITSGAGSGGGVVDQVKDAVGLGDDDDDGGGD